MASAVANGLRHIWHRLRWRRQYASDLLWFYGIRPLRFAVIRLQLSLSWQVLRRMRPHRLPGVLVVSLTSYPPRFGTLALTLRSLLCQTVRPDHLILWIAPADFALLPQSVRRLQARGLTIRLAEDIKSYKKIIPALDQFPDAFIVTADDDLFYWQSWLEELVKGAEPSAPVVALPPGARNHDRCSGPLSALSAVDTGHASARQVGCPVSDRHGRHPLPAWRTIS